MYLKFSDELNYLQLFFSDQLLLVAMLRRLDTDYNKYHTNRQTTILAVYLLEVTILGMMIVFTVTSDF